MQNIAKTPNTAPGGDIPIPGGDIPISPFSANGGGGDSLIDRWGRRITYIRLSVTDRCDFRCKYCMPMRVQFLPKKMIMSLEECLRVARVFSSLGVRKVRLTGGEPLVRPGIADLCEKIAALPGVSEVAITTNGSQLPKLAPALKNAGVRRVNISLDTLDEDKFRALTRTGELQSVLAGIDAALAADFPGGVKLNAVMIRGTNDGEISRLADFAMQRGMDISFIEEMPLGDVGYRRSETYYSAEDALSQLQKTFALQESDFNSGGPARYWRTESGGKIGFITPHSRNFCSSCNRVRITASGRLYPCLGGEEYVDLLDAARQQSDAPLTARIMEAMDIKPEGHEFNVHSAETKVVRFMSATGG